MVLLFRGQTICWTEEKRNEKINFISSIIEKNETKQLVFSIQFLNWDESKIVDWISEITLILGQKVQRTKN